jgi:arylsulfatase A-like enzyme
LSSFETIKYFILTLILFIFTLSPVFAAEKKNVILVTFDAMGARYLPFYGFDRNTAPNLDSFSKECLLFTNVISQSGSTSISLGSLFTSYYPFTDNLMTDVVNFKKNKLCLPHVLQGKGYHTYAIVRDEYAKSGYGFGHGFDYFDEDYPPDGNTAEETFDSAISLIKNLKEPFFLWIHNEEPHSPYLPPEKYFREFYPERNIPTIYSLIGSSKGRPYEMDLKNYRRFNRYLLNLSEESHRYEIYGREMTLGDEEIKQLRARYWGNIKYADEHFGRFLKWIKAQPFFNRTIVVITSDHGESLGAHHLFDHNELYQDIIHVPLLLHLPGQNFRKIVDKPAELVDIYPTLLNLLGLSVEHKIRGENLLQEKREKLFQFSEYPWKKILVENKMKYVCDQDLFYAYHLDRDPDELKMIAEQPASKERCKIPPLPDDIFFDSGERVAPVKMPKKDIKEILDLPSPTKLHIGSTQLKKFQWIDLIELKEKKVYVFIKGNEHLKIEVAENVTPDLAHQIINGELFQIKSVFAKSFSPYPEQLSREIECSKDLMPTYDEAKTGDERRPYLLTFSNERFGIGICSKDLISFRYLMGWIYCPQEKELYKIRYYIPKDQNDKILIELFTTLTCQP